MGMSEFYGASDDAKSEDLLHEALHAGVTFFDTADVYGHGHNERLLGRCLSRHPSRAQLVIASKGGIVRDPTDATRRGVDTSFAYLRDAAYRSRDRLGTTINLYYLHRVANEGAQIESSMEAMAKLLSEGVIEAVGICEASVNTIRRADASLRNLTNGQHGLAAVQAEYSLMSRGIEEDGVKSICEDLGLLLVAYSPISRGLLADANFDPNFLSSDDFRRTLPRFEDRNLAHNLTLVHALQSLAYSLGVTPAQISLAWVMSRGGNIVPIPGTRHSSRLHENMRTLNLEIPTSVFAHLDQIFAHGVVAGSRYAAPAMAAYGISQ
jgi:aryl-alcohol dehydrogenase-like predicted oxidoreductase